MSNLVDTIEFRAASKRTPLPGLDEALTKLRALDSALKLVQNRLAGISTQSAFKQTAKQFEALVRDAGFSKAGAGGGVGALARRLGLPDVKDVKTYARQMETTLQQEIGKIQRRIDSGLGGAKAKANAQKQIEAKLAESFFTDASAKAFKNPRTAGRFFEQYGKAATAQEKQGREALNAILSGRSHAPVSSPGYVPVMTPVAATLPAAAPLAGGGGGSRGGGTVLQKFREDVAAIKRTLAEDIKGLSDVTTIAAHREKAAAQIRAVANPLANPKLAQESTTVQKSLEDAAALDKRAHDARTKLRADQLKAIHQTEQQLADAKAANDKAEQSQLKKRLAEQKKTLTVSDREGKAADQERAKQQLTQERKQDQQRRGLGRNDDQQAALALEDYAENQRRTTHAAARKQIEAAKQKAGAQFSQRGQKETVEWEEGGRKMGVTADFSKSKAKVTDFSRALKATRDELDLLGGDFVRNTVKVAAWTASVGLLYTGMGLAAHSMSRVVEIGGQMARLDQVFNKVGGSTRDLTQDVLHLAAVNGRSTDEAMQSAVQWSRLGLTRVQVNEAVRVSLMAANVAELSAAEATEKLQAIMGNYGLRVGQLRTVLGELNQISNTYNVTNADMLEGISRTAAVAKQAGLPLQELMGLIGATVGATGQTGANIGNAVKSVTTALGNPALQKKLRAAEFEVRDGDGGMKSMSEILAQLYVRYHKYNEEQQRSLLFQVAGKTQSSRLAAILDNYVKGQTLAINAQLNLNSAEIENAKIKATLKSQLAGLTAEWERFVVVQSNHGPVQVLTQMSQALRNLLSIASNPAIGTLLTAVTGLAVAGGARTLLAGLRSGGTGFIGRSGQHLAQLGGSMNSLTQGILMQAAYGRSISAGTLGTGMKLTMYEKSVQGYLGLTQRAIASNNLFARSFGQVAQLAGAGVVALKEFAGPLALIAGGIWVFNRAMEYFGASSEAAEKKLAGFNEEAQKSGAAAAAFSQAGRLFNTVQNALRPERGFQAMPAEQQRKLLEQSSAAVGLYENDPAKRAALQKNFADQAEAYRKQGNLASIVNLAEAERNKLISARREKLQEEFEAQRTGQAELAREIQRLEKLQQNPLGNLGLNGLLVDGNKLNELRRRQSENQGEQMRVISELNDSYQQEFEHDQQHLTALEKQKTALEGIAELFQSIGTNNPLERHYVRLAGLDAQRYANALRLQQLEQQDAADLAGQSQRDSTVARLNADLEKYRTLLQQVRAENGGSLAGVSDIQIPGEGFVPLGELQNRINKLQSQSEAAKGGRVPGMENTDWARRQEEMRVYREKNEAFDREAAAERASRRAREEAAKFQEGGATAGRSTIASNFGVDEGERLLNVRKNIAEQLRAAAELEKKGPLSSGERGAQLNLLQQFGANRVALLEREANLHREIKQLVVDQGREFQRSIFGAGPAEMLRKLAALRTAYDKNGRLAELTPGQMFGMSPEMRGDVAGAQGMSGRVPKFSFNPDLNERKKELGEVTKGLRDDPGWGALAERLGQITEKMATEVPAAFQAGMDVLSKSTTAFATALDGLSSKINSILGGSGTDKLYKQPFVPNGGGVMSGQLVN